MQVEFMVLPMTNAAAVDLMRIGELGRQSDLPVKTLRYYEELGLIQSENRTEGDFGSSRPPAYPD